VKDAVLIMGSPPEARDNKKATDPGWGSVASESLAA